ncbi:orotate phosphoribosyltransferase [Roseomonas sp. GC11]|uniref:orotate phosphoribosyltransferase n=1 Tax=Roseomonas sp. GC11 TaxID=2950546 RepID=UPI002109AE5E|nr:orotate phosphoribosyltransferase [Roseomonas sp. GC11]MCQ4158612.1 orotate phosphoribosyltransferase [Roseomonas sp. GC11]
MSLDPHRAITGQAVARLLLAAGAIRVSAEQPFFLAAGWASPVYVDCRLLIGRPRWRRSVTDLAVATLRRAPACDFTMVAGCETAGIPWAGFLAERLDLPLRYVRKRPLGIGRHAQVEGGPVEGEAVLLVDDLVTDGTSKAAFVRGLRQAGAVVEDLLVLFHHALFPGSRERLADLALRLHVLAGWEDLLRLDPAEGMEKNERAVLEAFLADPLRWSGAHGGREG